MRKSFLFILVLVQSYFGTLAQVKWTKISSQEAAKYIDKLNRWYIDHENYSFKVNIASFASHESKEPVEVSKNIFIKRSDTFYNSTKGISNINTSSFSFVVDTMERIIYVDNPSNGQLPKQFNADLLNSNLNKCDLIEKKETNGLVHLKIHSATSQFDELEFYLDSNNRMVKMIIWYGNKVEIDEMGEKFTGKPRIEIEMYDYAEVNNKMLKWMNAETYVTSKDGKLLPAYEYKNYKIKDLRYN